MKIRGAVKCNQKNVIYLITCPCDLVYVSMWAIKTWRKKQQHTISPVRFLFIPQRLSTTSLPSDTYRWSEDSKEGSSFTSQTIVMNVKLWLRNASDGIVSFVFWVVCISNIDSKCWKNPSWKWSHCLLKNREPVQIQSRFFLCIVPDIVMRRFILLFSLSPVMGIVPAGVWQVIQLPFDLWERSSDAGVGADSSLMTHSYGLLVEEGKKN